MFRSVKDMGQSGTFPFLPTLVGFVAAQFTGYLWYGPLFGKTWLKAMKEQSPNMTIDQHDSTPIVVAGITWLTSSVCFSTLVHFWHGDSDNKKLGLAEYFCLAHTAWLGFSVPGHVFGHVFSEQHKTVCLLGASCSFTAYTCMALAHWML